jgi:hypothetical protein
MSYTEAPATVLLATNCIICGRPLVDACSVECGIGPECRSKFGIDPGVSEEVRKLGNQLTHRAAIAAQAGKVEEVRKLAIELEALGLITLGDKVAQRFKKAEQKVKITITQNGDTYRVETPFRRKGSDEFVAAWRAIPGRRYSNGVNLIPVAQGQALFALLKQFFPGEYGTGPKGVFQIPKV